MIWLWRVDDLIYRATYPLLAAARAFGRRYRAIRAEQRANRPDADQ